MSLTARRPLTLLAIAAIAVAAAFAFGLVGGTSGPAPAVAAPKTVTIEMKNMAYSKKTVTIKVGQRIKWVNRDSMKHDARSKQAGGPKGPLLAKGKSWTWTAKKAGTFNIYCTPHASFMKAKVIVKK